MSTTVKREYIFDGTAKWVTNKPHAFPEGNKWLMSFYPDTLNTRKAVQATGAKNHVKLDDETGDAYFVFRSDEPYKIIDNDGQEITAAVGNGSDVKIKLYVEAFTSPKYGPTARTKLLEVMVTKLIPYEKPVEQEVTSVAPAQADLPV